MGFEALGMVKMLGDILGSKASEKRGEETRERNSKVPSSNSLGEFLGHGARTAGEEVLGAGVEFVGNLGEAYNKVEEPVKDFAGEVASGFTKSEDPASTANASSETKANLISTAAKEHVEGIRTAAELAPHVEDEKTRENIAEGLKIFKDPGTVDLARLAVLKKAGLTEPPSKEMQSAFIQVSRDLNDLIEKKTLRRDSILNKDRASLSDVDKGALGLVSVIPLLLGGLVGGKKGLMKGIAASLGSAGSFLSSREEGRANDEVRVDKLEGDIASLLNLKSQVEGRALDTDVKKLKLESLERDMNATLVDPSIVARMREDRGGKSGTEAENKSVKFALSMKNSERIYDDLIKGGFDPTSARNQMESSDPDSTLGDYLRKIDASDETRLYFHALAAFTESAVRDVSGAAIRLEEYEAAIKTYFPDFGDSQEVMREKANSRAVRLKGTELSTGLSNELLQDIYGFRKEEPQGGEPETLEDINSALADIDKLLKGSKDDK